MICYGVLGHSELGTIDPSHPQYAEAEKQWRRKLLRLSGLRKLPEDCSHERKSFNGYDWRCKDCGKKVE